MEKRSSHLIFTEQGRSVWLGPALSSAGGEGTIYEVADCPSLVAKLYHSPPPASIAEKLRRLCQVAGKDLSKVAALPRSILFADGDRHTVRGFLMPRIRGKEIHQLYNPRARHIEFPRAAWDFLIHVAKNCAAAFETLHENGLIMADVNEKNFLVTEDGLVGLVDCDSYQVRNGNGQFLCNVGVPLWTPPELQGLDFRGLVRTSNHDRFGLAVLIFELLFMGRHPFAGIPDGQRQYEIHETIQEFLFAFSPHTWQRGVKPPPHTLPLTALPTGIARLFERAFLPGSERPDARPTGREWARELHALYLARKDCHFDPSHKYWNGLNNCPWCQLLANRGPHFFISVALHLDTTKGGADASALWVTIERVAKGDLMARTVGTAYLPPVAGRAMPVRRPIAPRLSKPQSPPLPVLLPTPVIPPPCLPSPPNRILPAVLPKLPLSPYETAAKRRGWCTSLGATVFLPSVLLGFLVPAAMGGILAFVSFVLWIRASERSEKERTLRLERERHAQEQENQRAKNQHAELLARHEVQVKEIEAAHAKAVMEAEATRAREQAILDADYRSKSEAYSAQLKLYEEASKAYEAEKAAWEKECSVRQQVAEQARRELTDAVERLRSTITGYQAKVRSLMPSLEAAYRSFTLAARDEEAELRALEAKKRDAQLRQFLDTFLIRNHRIQGIGQVKVATLVAFGVETALDITPTMRVTGIGPVLLNQLRLWRASCEAKFRYNPSTPLPQAEVQAVKLRYAPIRQSTFAELRGGAGALAALEADTRRKVALIEGKLSLLEKTCAEALADHAQCS